MVVGTDLERRAVWIQTILGVIGVLTRSQHAIYTSKRIAQKLFVSLGLVGNAKF